jgi:signal transduction histidine kinase
MNLLALAPLIAAICNLLLTLFVFGRNVRATINRVFFFWGISVTVWNVGTYFLFRVDNAADALLWARFLQFGVIFIPITLFHLSLLIAQVRAGKWIYWLYAFHGLLALSNCFGLFISGVRSVGYAYYSVAGPGFWPFAMAFSLTGVSIYILLKKRRSLPSLHRKRLTAFIVAQATLVILGTNDILPIFHIDHYPFFQFQILPLGSIAAVFYGTLVGYSVIQYQLLDVQFAFSRLAAQAVRLLFVFLVGVCLLLLVVVWQPGQFNAKSFCIVLGLLLSSATITAVFFPRLFGSGGESFERRLLGDRFEYHDRVRNFIASMASYGDTDLLLGDLDELLVATVHVSSYKIILLDETSRVFSLFRAHPEEAAREFPDVNAKSPVFRFFQDSKSEYVACNPTHLISVDESLELQALRQLAPFDAEFCFPFFFDHEPFGLLLLGKKKSGEPYTATDVSLLVSLVKNLSLMINQIRLKNQVLHAQEIELLGRMSRGLAHDLNNLLTPVWTMAELASTGASLEDLAEDILPVALRNLKTMRAYIREALFFSEHLRPDIQLGRLDMLVAQAVDLVEAKRQRKSISVVVNAPPDALVEMDEVLIQRLVGNVLSNAIDASPARSTIRIDVARLAPTETSRDWFRVRVIDQGEGIKPEDMNRIALPYFTTKNRGDEARGFGLGLAICRKIVNLHGGKLNISSQYGTGTTVQIDLPSRQTRSAAPASPPPLKK